jgi:two-component system sensor histidine kinase UhpB
MATTVRQRLWPESLFGRVFLVNSLLFTLAVVLLAVTPLTVSNPVTGGQLVWLAIGLVVLLAANVLLLRVSLAPLRRLTQLMGRIDLLQPGERIEVAGARELNVVSASFNEMLDRLEHERQASSSRSLGREEAERRRIAGELHDQVGQGMTALLLQLKTVLDEAPDEVRPDIVEAQRIARENLDEVGRIARRLRPSVLDDLGLAYALMALVDAAEDQAALTFVRDIDADVPRLLEDVELALYRIAQEALTNAMRHSGAARIDVVLVDTAAGVRLLVADDGRGMIDSSGVEGGGIRGMRERALTIDADLRISTHAGKGTAVSVVVA